MERLTCTEVDDQEDNYKEATKHENVWGIDQMKYISKLTSGS